MLRINRIHLYLMLRRVSYAIILSMIAASFSSNSMARSVSQCARWCPHLNRIAGIGQAGDEDASWAFYVLRSVAENQPKAIDAASAYRLGLAIETLESAPFYDMEIRAHAYLQLGSLPSPYVIPYLSSIQPEMFADESERTFIFRHVRIAWHRAQMLLRNSAKEQQDYLAHLLLEEGDDDWFSWVQLWAIDELCDQGAGHYLHLMDQRLMLMHNGHRANILMFCRERVQIINRDPNRHSALSRVLTVENATANARVVHWAITELGKLDTKEAKATIDAFLSTLEAIPGLTPDGKAVHSILNSYGRTILPARPHKTGSDTGTPPQ